MKFFSWKKWRRPIYQMLATVVFYTLRLLYLTLKVRVVYHEGYSANKQYLGAFWHGKMFAPMFAARNHQTKMAVLVSPSKDGDIISGWLHSLGYETVRGSSRRNNVSALSGMLRKLKEGYSIGVIMDGPLGPIHKVKPGIVHMAKKLEVEIVPVGVAIKRKWVFTRAWDKFELPKPFSDVVMYSGTPITVPVEASLDDYCERVEQGMRDAERKAQAMVVV
jgi:lysophospholipid acyltransferase (LPLAT)-like uncharacterized protein